MISVMMANNEIGTIQPVEEIGQLVMELKANRQKNLVSYRCSSGCLGKLRLMLIRSVATCFLFLAHKIYAPKGVGGLYIGRGVRLQSQNIGGHQERERRGGTESVPLVVGFGKACELALSNLTVQNTRIRELRDSFEKGVSDKISAIVFNGNRDKRLPNISNISFRKIEGEALLINLDLQGISVSTGSACSSGSLEPSPVIRALGS